MTPEEISAVAELWHRAGLATYTYLPTWQALTFQQAQRIFRDHIAPNCEIWVGERDGILEAFLALEGDCIDRLYVAPEVWRQGWGKRLVAFAKQQRPDGLTLYTHQANHGARALYEQCGFSAEAFGISPPPESAPDVFYRWTPTQGESHG